MLNSFRWFIYPASIRAIQNERPHTHKNGENTLVTAISVHIVWRLSFFFSAEYFGSRSAGSRIFLAFYLPAVPVIRIEIGSGRSLLDDGPSGSTEVDRVSTHNTSSVICPFLSSFNYSADVRKPAKTLRPALDWNSSQLFVYCYTNGHECPGL